MVCCGDYKFDRELSKNSDNIDIVHMHTFRTFQNYILYRFYKIELLSETINSVLESYKVALSKTQIAKDYILSKMSMNSRAQEYIDGYQRAIENHGGSSIK